MSKRKKELDDLGPIETYGPRHRGATVTARVDSGPPAPRRTLAETHDSWQPQGKWFWRTLAQSRPSTGGPQALGQGEAQSEEWKQRMKDRGIVNGRQYGRWEKNAAGQRRWQRGIPGEQRPWQSDLA